jgi:hypothetical protein
MFDGLKRTDRFVELLSHFGVVDRRLEEPFAGTYQIGGDQSEDAGPRSA